MEDAATALVALRSREGDRNGRARTARVGRETLDRDLSSATPANPRPAQRPFPEPVGERWQVVGWGASHLGSPEVLLVSNSGRIAAFDVRDPTAAKRVTPAAPDAIDAIAISGRNGVLTVRKLMGSTIFFDAEVGRVLPHVDLQSHLASRVGGTTFFSLCTVDQRPTAIALVHLLRTAIVCLLRSKGVDQRHTMTWMNLFLGPDDIAYMSVSSVDESTGPFSGCAHVIFTGAKGDLWLYTGKREYPVRIPMKGIGRAYVGDGRAAAAGIWAPDASGFAVRAADGLVIYPITERIDDPVPLTHHLVPGFESASPICWSMRGTYLLVAHDDAGLGCEILRVESLQRVPFNCLGVGVRLLPGKAVVSAAFSPTAPIVAILYERQDRSRAVEIEFAFCDHTC